MIVMTCLWNDNYCAESINVAIPADEIHAFFISNTFLKAKAKQQPDASLTLSFKNDRIYYKNVQKTSTFV